ncbi:MAG: family oxidoreductase [Conexibacter sp.]|nr:family oxidoreductase [Conexibacter sp.]
MAEHERPTVPAQLPGQTVVILGGSAGIGLAVAELARAHGAEVILTGRDQARLDAAAAQVGARRSAAFDATDHAALAAFLATIDEPLDHVFVSAGGPYYAPLADIDLEEARAAFSRPLALMVDLARLAAPKLRPGGTLLFMSGTGARHPGIGLTVIGATVGAITAATANLALEIAPARISTIAAGFVDTPLSARLLGDDLDQRREQLRRELPIHRVVQASDVAALAVHLMANTAITGSVYDIDGGQQLL